jgi:hypothetical protein
MHIVFSFKCMSVTLLFISLEKDKRTPRSKDYCFLLAREKLSLHYNKKKNLNHFSLINFTMTKVPYEKGIFILNYKFN